MAWAYFLFGSILAQSIAHVLSRVVMREAVKSVWAYAALSQIITGTLIFLYAFIAGFEMPPLIDLWPWFTAVVLLNVGSNYFQFEALRTAEISFFTIFTSIRVVISMIAATLFLSEEASIVPMAGAALMLFAVALSFTKQFELKIQPWMVPASLYALSSGLIFIFDARIVSDSDPASYMAFAFFVPGIATMLFRPSIIPDMGRLIISSQIKNMLLYSIGYGFMAVTMWLAYAYGATASEIAPIRQASVILTVILSIVFLGERSHMLRKFAAALLATLAVYLIARG